MAEDRFQERSPTSVRRWTVIVVAAIGAVFILSLAVWGWRWVAVAGAAPAGEAEWIWAALPRDHRSPTAFWAARDFELGAVPAAAELLTIADEEYIVYLNGHRVGSNVYAPGARLDVYRVAPLLRPGVNRLAAELRSGRGAGGFLACLRDPASGRSLGITDGDWRVFEAQREGLLDPSVPLGGAPAVRSWGRHPAGRWGSPERGQLRPLFEQVVAAGGPLQPRRGAALGEPLAWQPVGGKGRGLRGPALAYRPGVIFDWGREVFGYLNLQALRSAPRPAALLFTAERPFDPLTVAPAGGEDDSAGGGGGRLTGLAAGSPVFTVPGRRSWTDAVPRRFRYAAAVGMRGLVAAWVDEVDAVSEEAAALPRAPEPVVAGVFGVSPPPLRSPVEDEVRRELERLAAVAGRPVR